MCRGLAVRLGEALGLQSIANVVGELRAISEQRVGAKRPDASSNLVSCSIQKKARPTEWGGPFFVSRARCWFLARDPYAFRHANLRAICER